MGWVDALKVKSSDYSDTARFAEMSHSSPPHHLLFSCTICFYLSCGGSGKEPACQCRRHKRCCFNFWVGKILLEKEIAVHSCIFVWRVPWTEKPESYGAWVRKESYMTGATYHTRMTYLHFQVYNSNSKLVKIEYHRSYFVGYIPSAAHCILVALIYNW